LEGFFDCGLCLLAGEDHRCSCFRVNRILVVDLYRFLAQKASVVMVAVLPRLLTHTGVQEREQAHAGRILGALDGFIPARLAQVEQLVEVVDAGAIVREGDEGGESGGGSGLVVTVTRDAPARRAFWSSSTKTWLSLLVNSRSALLRILALTCA
jgi:hypothetical protein